MAMCRRVMKSLYTRVTPYRFCYYHCISCCDGTTHIGVCGHRFDEDLLCCSAELGIDILVSRLGRNA